MRGFTSRSFCLGAHLMACVGWGLGVGSGLEVPDN